MAGSSSPPSFTEVELRPVAEEAVGEPLFSFSMRMRPVSGSDTSDKQFATISYTAQDGRSGEVELFVKRCCGSDRHEAVHYRYLASCGVPTPRLYGALLSGDGVETLFLETIVAPGIRFDSADDWRKMLTLLARFNACPLSAEYRTQLRSYHQVGALEGGVWLLGLDPQPSRVEIEGQLRALGASEQELPSLVRSAESLFAQAAAHPQALLHLDFTPDNYGRSTGRKDLVVFDLQKNAAGPRFADVALYLALPDWSPRAAYLDQIEESGLTLRAKLIQHYLRELERFGGGRIQPETFRQETSTLFWIHKISAAAWLTRSNVPGRSHEVLDALRRLSLNR